MIKPKGGDRHGDRTNTRALQAVWRCDAGQGVGVIGAGRHGLRIFGTQWRGQIDYTQNDFGIGPSYRRTNHGIRPAADGQEQAVHPAGCGQSDRKPELLWLLDGRGKLTHRADPARRTRTEYCRGAANRAADRAKGQKSRALFTRHEAAVGTGQCAAGIPQAADFR